MPTWPWARLKTINSTWGAVSLLIFTGTKIDIDHEGWSNAVLFNHDRSLLTQVIIIIRHDGGGTLPISDV
jgi:hypothetical protein